MKKKYNIFQKIKRNIRCAKLKKEREEEILFRLDSTKKYVEIDGKKYLYYTEDHLELAIVILFRSYPLQLFSMPMEEFERIKKNSERKNKLNKIYYEKL